MTKRHIIPKKYKPITAEFLIGINSIYIGLYYRQSVRYVFFKIKFILSLDKKPFFFFV